jgi:hypothetical protein
MYELPGVWRKCSEALSSLRPQTLPHQPSAVPLDTSTTTLQAIEYISTELGSIDPVSYWQWLQGCTAAEIAKEILPGLQLEDLYRFATQVVVAGMPEHHPLLSIVRDSLDEACTAARGQSCSSANAHVQHAWLQQLRVGSAMCSLKDLASTMKALSWQGMASDVLLQELAEAVRRIVASWDGASPVPPNHLVDIILQIADAGK